MVDVRAPVKFPGWGHCVQARAVRARDAMVRRLVSCILVEDVRVILGGKWKFAKVVNSSFVALKTCLLKMYCRRWTIGGIYMYTSASNDDIRQK